MNLDTLEQGGEPLAEAVARDSRPSRLAGAGAPLLTAVAYFVAASLGESLAFPSTPLSALWAPNAILLAALLLARPDRWWIYLLAVLPFHFLAQLTDVPLPQVVIQYVLNSTQAVLGAWTIWKFCPRPLRFDRVQTAIVLIVFAGIAAPFVTSVLMAAAFVVLDLSRGFGLTVIARTITNTFAVVALVPLIVHSIDRLRTEHKAVTLARVAEAGALAVCLTAVSFLVFALPLSGADRAQLLPYASALLYAPVPLLAWAAIRFGVAGACSAALLVGAVSTWGTLNGYGPFTGDDPVRSALSLVSFHALGCIAFVMFAALLEEWRYAERARGRAEVQQLRAENLHAAVLASLLDQVAILDSAGTIVEVNDSWKRALETASPARFDRLLVGENLLAACTRAAGTGDGIAAQQLNALKAVLDGSELRRQFEFSQPPPENPRWFEVSVEKLRRPEGGAVMTRTEVTARKQAEVEARSQGQQVRHLGRAAVLGQLSGAFAHELNQPLTSILGNAEAGLRLLASGSTDVREIGDILRDIVQDDERAAQVIRRLRALLGKGDVERDAVDLNVIVREALELTRSELITRNVQITTNLDQQLQLVMADRVQMQQVLLNLLINACEAVAGNPVAERKLSLNTRFIPHGNSVEITVTDNGCGIPAADVDRIFQPFVTTKSQGMGLGLAICRSVAESHDGRLWAENGESGGAVFHLTVPVGAGLSSRA